VLLLVLGALLPTVVIAVAAVLFFTHRHHVDAKSAPVPAQSIPAFEACMKDEGADTPSMAANWRLLAAAADACKQHLPKGIPLPDFTPPAQPAQTPRDSFQECLRSVLAGLAGNGGTRFSRPSQKAYRNAVALCRSLAPGAPGQGRATT
jgi:hypothetical protein